MKGCAGMPRTVAQKSKKSLLSPHFSIFFTALFDTT
jgi:hypothetical protein